MWGPIISGIGSVIGGLLGSNAQEKANEVNRENAMRQEALQREFAQNGIQWKVQDAEKAGIHPLYALGANTVSYSPNVVGHTPETGLAGGISSASQDISRAIESTRTAKDSESAFTKTAQALSLEKAGLENQLLTTQIAKMRGQLGPTMPSLTDANWVEGQSSSGQKPRVLRLPTGDIVTPGSESKQDDISKEYGDEGLPQIPGQYRFMRDWIMSGREQNKKIWGGKTLADQISSRTRNPNRRNYSTPDYSSFLYY